MSITSRWFRNFAIILLICGATSLVRAQTVQPTPSNSIRGKVTYRDTHNPVRRADVRLYPFGGGEATVSVRTNSDGEFELQDVPPGRYLAVAIADNLVALYRTLNDSTLLDRWLLGQSECTCAEVTVAAKGITRIDLSAQRGGAIAGQVLGDDGLPIAQAEIGVYVRIGNDIRPYVDGRSRPVGGPNTMRTDDQGNYRIAGLASGTYFVQALERPPDAALLGHDPPVRVTMPIYYPSAILLADAAPINVLAGRDTSSIDVKIPVNRTHTVGVKLYFRPTGELLSHAQLAVFGVGDDFAVDRQVTSVGSDFSDGPRMISGLPSGRYVLRVKNVGRSANVMRGGKWEGVLIAPTNIEFSIGNEDIPELKVEVEPAASISGVVKTIGPKADLSGLSFQAIDTEREQIVATDYFYSGPGPTGNRIELDELAEGSYRLRLDTQPKTACFISSITLDGKDVTNSPLVVASGQQLKRLVVTLSTNFAKLSGRVTASAGSDPTRLSSIVVLVPADPERRRTAGTPIVSAVDTAGNFDVALAPGDYFVTAVVRNPLMPIILDEGFWENRAPRLRPIRVSAGAKLANILVALEGETK